MLKFLLMLEISSFFVIQCFFLYRPIFTVRASFEHRQSNLISRKRWSSMDFPKYQNSLNLMFLIFELSMLPRPATAHFSAPDAGVPEHCRLKHRSYIVARDGPEAI